MKHHPNHGKRPKKIKNDSFLILTVGHKNVRLYKGDRKTLNLVDIKNFPADMEQTLGIDEYANERSVHSVVRAGRVTDVAMSQYDTGSTDKVMLKEFFRHIDRALHDILTEQSTPLILAGVDYIQALYRTVNSYPNLLGEGISGNHDETKEKELQRRALAIIDSHP